MCNDHNGTWDEILKFECENNLNLAYGILKESLECSIENNEDDPEQQEFYKEVLKRL